jgi:VWFA-related protein
MAAVALLPLIATSAARYAGKTAGQQDPVPVYRAGVELVVFNVAVLDDDGLPVTDLEAGDFRLLEDGREQEVSLFASPESSDLDVALVLDASSSIAQNAPTVREDAMAFLQALGPHDCVYFVPFRESVDDSMWAAPDDPRLAARIGGLALDGGTALYDALVVAFGNVHRNAGPLLAPPPGGWPQQGYDGPGCGAPLPPRALGIPGAVRRTALVVLSDGGDEHSRAGFAETLGVAWSDPVPIFAVAIGDALPPRRDRRLRVGSEYARSFRRRGDIAQALTGRLGYLAHISGGRLILGGDSDTLGESFDTVVQMLRSSYLVGYKPPDVDDAVSRGGLEWHPVDIAVPRREVEVFARPGYYRRLVDMEGAERIVRETVDDVREGPPDSVLPLLDFALRLDPEYWPAWLQRARARARAGDLSGARDDLLRVLELRPGTLDAHYLLANVAYDLSEYDLAWQQAVRAHRGGALVTTLLRALEEVSEPPADLQQQLRAPATFVDIGATPDELDQGTMLEVLRALRRAVSDAPDLALMAPWNAADLGIILDVEEVGGSPRRLSGEFVLTYAPYLSWEDENVEITDLDDPAAVAEGLGRALDKVRALVAEQR